MFKFFFFLSPACQLLSSCNKQQSLFSFIIVRQTVPIAFSTLPYIILRSAIRGTSVLHQSSLSLSLSLSTHNDMEMNILAEMSLQSTDISLRCLPGSSEFHTLTKLIPRKPSHLSLNYSHNLTGKD